MRKATIGQILHINRMYLDGGLSRVRFEEVNHMAAEGILTFDAARAITEGKYAFRSTFSDAHLAKIRRAWKAFGRKVFGVPFEKYLNGTDGLEAVPALPVWPDAWSASFDRDVLVDGRVAEKIGLTETCNLAGLAYGDMDDTFEPYDPARALSGIRWMRGQAGHRNRNRRSSECHASFAAFEVGMDAVEGVFTYVDDHDVIRGHYMDLVGSVSRDDRDGCACLGILHGRPELYGHWDDDAASLYRSASRGSP